MVAEAGTATKTEVVEQANQHAIPVRAYLALALGALCIGFSAIFTKWANVDGPVSGFYRVGIATAVLAIPFAVHTLRRRRRTSSEDAQEKETGLPWHSLLGVAALAGLFFSMDLALWNTSLLYTNAANSTLLGNTSTLWVALGAALIFHESLKRRFWWGMVLALAGSAVILGRDVLQAHSLGWGDLLAIGSSLFYAAYLLSTQRARRHLDTLSFMWLSSCAAAIALLTFCLVTGLQMTGFTLNQYMALLALAIISHVIGWLSINYSLGHLPAPITAVSLLSQPVVTAIVAVPLLGEAITLYQLAGGLLVLVGIYIVNRR